MKASQITHSLETLIQIKQPAFLWGPPGIGKSQVVAQTASQLGLELIDVRAVLLDPVDLRGIPRITPGGEAQWCAPSFLPRRGEGVLFLDELNAAPPLVQAACYQLVLDRRIGEYELPPGWTVIAAGNREQDRAVAHRMPSALANRFVHLEFEVDARDWGAWARGAGIAPEVSGFIRFRPALLHAFDPDRDDKAFPSPRSWEFVSRLMAAPHSVDSNGDSKDRALFREMVAGTVGAGAAAEFMGFLRVWNQLPSLGDILGDPDGMAVPQDPAVLFALSEMLGRAMTVENSQGIMIFAARLPVEFSVLLVREAVRLDNDLVKTQAFAQWARENAEVLV
ncbi:MAG: MoxR family ATPase [Desulfovibrionales bacterium]|nr:MoxR family ATPase [Desulfovibrionales bacterium]